MKPLNSVKKNRPRLFKNVLYKMFLEIICLIQKHKNNLALNNLQWLTCLKVKPKQT